ncbi:hypothetical protein HU200_043975 [Digitaria exilis]|uniref:Uncharacterized protein n=1 Tax=Digitaria exilis TaxID=1010633 RepID=A0A835B2E5_9POAL|nr:hypothetical protein HU200_043975 [Digitaria exilis]
MRSGRSALVADGVVIGGMAITAKMLVPHYHSALPELRRTKMEPLSDLRRTTNYARKGMNLSNEKPTNSKRPSPSRSTDVSSDTSVLAPHYSSSSNLPFSSRRAAATQPPRPHAVSIKHSGTHRRLSFPYLQISTPPPRRRRGTTTSSRAREPSIPFFPSPRILASPIEGERRIAPAFASGSPSGSTEASPDQLPAAAAAERGRFVRAGWWEGGAGPMTCARAEDAVSPADDDVAVAPVLVGFAFLPDVFLG